jgi:nickel-dependent lactate racemase
MFMTFLCDEHPITLRLPDDALVYESHFPPRERPAADLVLDALAHPVEGPSLTDALARRRPGDVVIVVSDITRPIPYATFLPAVLDLIERGAASGGGGVPREQILILIATGMHRASTPAERCTILGSEIAAQYRIEDHDAAATDLVQLPRPAWSGSKVRLNRRFMEAGFRLLTGLVEPHFMAGFSGGRKAICPGLADLATLRHFHGHGFMADARSRNGNLADNPCHQEAVSVAAQAGVDCTLNVVLDRARQVNAAFAGALEPAHAAACRYAAACLCREVVRPADVVLTSSGGYPLDATFYQCVKGFVSCLPAVREGGAILAFGGCREGVGSAAYRQTMVRYAGRWREFLKDIAPGTQFEKDQWQFQMHCRALDKVGQERLHFVAPGLTAEVAAQLSIHPHTPPADELTNCLQALLDQLLAGGRSLAVFPEGPYCVAVAR